MDDTYRWELIDMLKSARLADWLITQPDINQRLFIDAAKELEQLAAENRELRERQIKFRTIERKPFVIRDDND